MAFLGDDGRLDDVNQEDVERAAKGGGGNRGMLEAGWYRVALVEDEDQMKEWGIGLSMQFQILSGEYEGRRAFDYLCIRHAKSPEAERIARAKLMALATAAGVKDPANLSDTSVLYNRPVMIEIYREPDATKYAEADGCKARIGAFLSVAQFKAQKKGAHMPGISGPAKAPEPVTAAPARPDPQPDPEPVFDDGDIPF